MTAMKSQDELMQLHGEKYVESYESQPLLRLERLMSFIKFDKTFSVVDFACGNGILMEFIAPKVRSYIGVDFSEPFIKAANTKKKNLYIENANFICSDINLFCNNHIDAFDMAFAMDVSEHLYDTEWRQILSSIRKSLKANAKFYIHTPNADFFFEKMKSKNFLVKQFPQHVAIRTPEQNSQIIRDAGFEIENMWLLPHYNSLKFVHPISYIPSVGKYFKARVFIEAKNP